MATAVIYPARLPCPTAAPVTPTERRRVTELPGQKNFTNRQRDYHGTQDVTWIFTAQEAKTFDDWWRGRLRRGGFWFAADWPLPSGNTDNVYRFLTAPAWSYQPGGYDLEGIFTVTAKLEIRGRGMMPKDYLVVALTSRPYPLDPSDEMTGSADYLGGQIFGWPDDGAEIGGDFLDGTLIYEYHGLIEVDTGPDEMTGGADFLDGTLIYEYHGFVEFDTGPDDMMGGGDFLAGTLVMGLIRYQNYIPEEMSVAGDILGGTLTLGV